MCCAVPLHWTKCARDAAFDTIPFIEGHNAPTPRNQVHQSLERSRHGFEVFVDISVVEFNRGKDHSVREIVQKLWAFVEECSVVLVGLDDEMLSAAKLKTTAKIFCDPADQE